MASNYRTKLLASTLLVATGLLASPAFAQDAGSSPTGSAASSGASVPATRETIAQSDAGEPTQDVVVTGSRINRPDLASSSPVATISGEALKVSNAVTVEQILNVNPQFQPSQTASSNNPGTGAATVDLRGLGSNRTLVLIDGKRAPAFDTTEDVDVNIIPTALIKRIDILTGGASAVYGSDAVAGVVNFILDDRFTGLRIDGSSQVSTYGDAPQQDISVTGGVKLGDRGNLVGSFNYSHRAGITYGDRSDEAQALNSANLQPTGSSNTVPTAFDIPGAGRQQVQPDGSLSRNVALYNYAPVNLAVIPLERLSGMVLGRYELTDHIEAYVRGNFEHLESVTTLAPTATAGFAFDIHPDNPFLTAGERNAFFNTVADPNLVINPDGSSTVGIRRRVIETGGRIEDHTTNSYQIVGGLRGDLGGGFTYDVFGQYGRVERHDLLKNDLSYNALTQALDAVAGPNGTVVCRDPSNGCVPLNLFTTATIPQSQLAFVLRNAMQDTVVQQTVAGASVSGNLDFLKSPFANGPAAVSVGVEYRRESARTTVDADYASGDLIYYGQGQNIAGSFDTKEAYIEAKMPLVQDRPFFHALDLEGGFRYSHYSTVGDVYTYKGGGDYSPVDGIRFRGIYQRAVRAPNVGELFSPVVAGTGALASDPCSGTVSATTQNICIAQGAPTSAFRNGISSVPEPVAAQINIFSGGNPKLQAEKTDTYTLGVVINPPQLRALSISFDYYNINIGNAVGAVPASVLVGQCFNIDQNASSAACSSIKRNPLDGSLSGNIIYGVPQVAQNLSSIKTQGFDLSVGYHGGSSAGFNYAVAYAGTFIKKYTYQPVIGSTTFRCDGNFGGDCDLEPMPKYKHVFSVILGYQAISLDSRWQYLGPVHEDADTDILVSRIKPFSYFDETLSFNVNEKFAFRLGALNILNKRPPIVGDTVGNSIAQNLGGTYPNTYDVIGRRVFAGFSATF